MSTRTLTRSSEMRPTLLEEFFRPWYDWLDTDGGSFRALSIPAANIIENKDAYHVSLAVPGMKKEDFNIDIDGNILTISCEKEEKKEEKEAKFTRKEFNYTSFNRSFTLPDEINKDKIDAHYEDGILKLSLPKKEEAKKLLSSKHIAVK